MKKKHIKLIALLLPFGLLGTSCNKLLEVTPKYIHNTKEMYANDQMADSVVIALYSSFANLQNDYSLITGLSSDELKPAINSFDPGLMFMYTYNINPFSGTSNDYWAKGYQIIGITNFIEEGVAQSTGMTQAGKNEVLGQARFMRALQYYFLINLYGDVPLILSTDYRAERIKPRLATSSVYTQIIKDLEEATQLLSDHYNGERIRATKWAAMALLSRIYLFTGNWQKADQAASAVIAQDQLFKLGKFDNQDGSKPMDIFLKNSPEQILQLWNGIGASIGGVSLGEFARFAVSEGQNSLLEAFEPEDKRKENYVKFEELIEGHAIYKYRSNGEVGMPNNEYTSVLRLSEQYLNRAEARMQLANISSGVDDLNTLRIRAGLTPLPNTLTKEQLLEAIVHERQVELCFEWGDRWFTLKRLGIVDKVMKIAKPKSWKTTAQLYPVPTVEIENNRQLKQNPGYNN